MLSAPSGSALMLASSALMAGSVALGAALECLATRERLSDGFGDAAELGKAELVSLFGRVGAATALAVGAVENRVFGSVDPELPSGFWHAALAAEDEFPETSGNVGWFGRLAVRLARRARDADAVRSGQRAPEIAGRLSAYGSWMLVRGFLERGMDEEAARAWLDRPFNPSWTVAALVWTVASERKLVRKRLPFAEALRARSGSWHPDSECARALALADAMVERIRIERGAPSSGGSAASGKARPGL